MKNTNKEIEDFVREFFRKINLSHNLKFSSVSEDKLSLELTLEDPQIFIGQRGENLISIQSLLNKIIRKKFQTNLYLDLDINNYKKRREEYLRELAQNSADDAVLSQTEKTLPSMPAYERRIIHLELKERNDVETESRGKEPNRRVIIKPSKK